jgi:hypothetical protein
VHPLRIDALRVHALLLEAMRDHLVEFVDPLVQCTDSR